MDETVRGNAGSLYPQSASGSSLYGCEVAQRQYYKPMYNDRTTRRDRLSRTYTVDLMPLVIMSGMILLLLLGGVVETLFIIR